MMNGHGQSDGCIVPKKSPNSLEGLEGMEGRRPAKGNVRESPMPQTQGWEGGMAEALERIRQAAKRDKGEKFTSLYHHVYNVEHLRAAYFRLKREAAPGIDGQTWAAYGEGLEAKLEDLAGRLRRGAYRGAPVRRVYIPKGDGRQRPLGVPAIEDKIVQRVVADILTVIWEEEFVGFSYGFRPGRNAHQALDALAVGIERKPVNWVLDADIRGFYDTIDHGWLVEMVEHRIGDKRVVRLVEGWLKAGVLEDGEWQANEEGTPQGGLVSPILANIYLHYVLDLWVQQWRQRRAQGEVVVVRYADDFVVGFARQADGERFQEELRARLAKFHLALQEEKTRLLEFGRFAAPNRKRRGAGKPATFSFLGFTHICGQTRKGQFTVVRQTMRKRLQAKVKAVKAALKLRLHQPVPVVGQWLRRVVLGHYQYYGVPLNSHALAAFRQQIVLAWLRALRRRSQRQRVTWARMARLARRWLPYPRICHPYPWQRFVVTT